MPAFHFILHAYGSWHPDHPAGWHQHNLIGARVTYPALGRYRRGIQKQESVVFSGELRGALVEMTRDFCDRRGLRCHAVAVNESHVHAVMSWKSDEGCMDVQRAYKRVLGWHAARVSGVAGRRWFSHDGKPKQVRDGEHLGYLVREYLRGQGGVYWREGM